MAKTTVIVPSMGKITLLDSHYLASGGEAAVYAKDGIAYKIYHDPLKMIPAAKIRELSKLTPSNVLKPTEILLNIKNVEIGYVMQYKKDVQALCRFFTKAFRTRNNITDGIIADIVQKIQDTVEQIHREGFLIVDLNEMNIMCSGDFKTPYFIDVDSYQTPSYKATAIMESIRDRRMTGKTFTDGSDWFSFAIIAFTMYIGIHPYQGSHPKYKPNEWVTRRMDDGVSAFDKDVSLPNACNPLSVIPPPHLAWMKDVFMKGVRTAPPSVTGKAALPVAKKYTYTHSAANFDVSFVREYPENILSIFEFMGTEYAVSANTIYKYDKNLSVDISGIRMELCESSDMTPVLCKLIGENLSFEAMNGALIGKLSASKMMYRNGCIYSFYGGKLVENSFVSLGNKTIHQTRIASSVSELTTKMFDGVVFEDLLGKCFVTIPYGAGLCSTINISELNGYRIMEAKSLSNICVVLAEHNGKYHRVVIDFDKNYLKYDFRKTSDVPYSGINFAVLNNGICVLATESGVEIFKGQQVKVITNPPFDSSTPLYNKSGSIHFIDGNKVYMCKAK